MELGEHKEQRYQSWQLGALPHPLVPMSRSQEYPLSRVRAIGASRLESETVGVIARTDISKDVKEEVDVVASSDPFLFGSPGNSKKNTKYNSVVNVQTRRDVRKIY